MFNEKSMKYRENNIAKNIAIFKIFWPKICHKLDKHLPYTLPMCVRKISSKFYLVSTSAGLSMMFVL